MNEKWRRKGKALLASRTALVKSERTDFVQRWVEKVVVERAVTTVTLLAQFGDWGCVQAEFDDMLPIRAFIPMSAIL